MEGGSTGGREGGSTGERQSLPPVLPSPAPRHAQASTVAAQPLRPCAAQNDVVCEAAEVASLHSKGCDVSAPSSKHLDFLCRQRVASRLCMWRRLLQAGVQHHWQHPVPTVSWEHVSYD